MSAVEAETGKRYKVSYRGQNLYVVITPTAVTLSMTHEQDFNTQAGLTLVENLIERVLEDADLEELAGICFSCSYDRNDLPGLVAWCLDRFLEEENAG